MSQSKRESANVWYIYLCQNRHVRHISKVHLNSFWSFYDIENLSIHAGIYATVFLVRGHVNDTTQSSMHGTDNSDDFWEDVYDLPMADFLRQYEQWALLDPHG